MIIVIIKKYNKINDNNYNNSDDVDHTNDADL